MPRMFWPKPEPVMVQIADPARVDWSQTEDGPRCEDCVNFDYPLCRRFRSDGRVRATWPNFERADAIDARTEQPTCGPNARYFTRKTPDVYDFQNNPPPVGEWAKD